MVPLKPTAKLINICPKKLPSNTVKYPIALANAGGQVLYITENMKYRTKHSTAWDSNFTTFVEQEFASLCSKLSRKFGSNVPTISKLVC